MPEVSVIITDQPCVLVDDYKKQQALRGHRRQVHRLRQLRRRRLPGDPRHAPREGGQAVGQGSRTAFVRIETAACTGCGLCVQPCAPDAIVHHEPARRSSWSRAEESEMSENHQHPRRRHRRPGRHDRHRNPRRSGHRARPRRQEDRSRRHGAARRRGLLAPALRPQGAVAADHAGHGRPAARLRIGRGAALVAHAEAGRPGADEHRQAGAAGGRTRPLRLSGRPGRRDPRSRGYQVVPSTPWPSPWNSATSASATP